MKTYIITGANGFLGNNIIRLLPKDAEVRALVLPNTDISCLDGLNCHIFYGDVTKIDTMHEIFDVSEAYVIHTAAIISIQGKNDNKIYDVNVGGTNNIIKKCLEHNFKLIYINSVHAMEVKDGLIKETYNYNPDLVVGDYAKSKAIAINNVLAAIKDENLNACILQPSGIIGPNDYNNTHLTQMLSDFAHNKLNICVAGGYNFVDVRDAASAIINACELGRLGSIYLVTNKYISIQELLNIAALKLNRKKIKVLPIFIAKIVAPFFEFNARIRHRRPLFTSYSLYTLTCNGNFDNTKAKEELKFKPRDIEETVNDTIDFIIHK